MVTANQPTIETYLYGAVAERAVRDKQPELAGHIMKQKYFNDRSNPILAQAYIDFYDTIRAGNNPLSTSVGRRISTERTKYDDILEGMALKDVVDSCLGNGLEDAVRKELVKKDGDVKFGEARKNVDDFREDAESRQKKFERKQDNIQTEYENAMLKTYTDEERRDVNDKYEEKLRGLSKEFHDDLKKLEDKYRIKDSQRAVGSVRAMEDAKFAVIRRDAVLNDAYFPVKLEDLRRISQN